MPQKFPDISSPLILAPMAGYTDSPFRQLCREQDAGMTYTELISSEGIVRRNDRTLDYLRFTEDERPIAVQIFGSSPDVMAEAAAIAAETRPDVIDINMGCCAPKITNGGAGAALICDPEKIGKIASAVVKAVKLPVSAKIRIGWDFSSINYRTTVKILEDSGISHIAVHGRTNSQKYNGTADWKIITEIAALTSLPVTGSGDISSYEQAMSRIRESGCKSVMIGRKAVGNPWIFSGKIPDRSEIKEMIIRHLSMMTDYYGEYGIILARKHLVKYIHDFKNSSVIRQVIVKAETRDEIIEALDSFEQ